MPLHAQASQLGVAVCSHCFEEFLVDNNPLGGCPEAPDRCLACIDVCSCIVCINHIQYILDLHGGDDWDYADHPWTQLTQCTSWRLWLAVLALSCTCCPCLCCYPVLRAGRTLGKRLGCIGERHEAISIRRSAASTVEPRETTETQGPPIAFNRYPGQPHNSTAVEEIPDPPCYKDAIDSSNAPPSYFQVVLEYS